MNMSEEGLPDRLPGQAGVSAGSGGVAFLGDSITAGGRWDLMFPRIRVGNFGIDGDRSDQVLERLLPLIRFRPSRIFLMIGTNDLGWGIGEDAIVCNVAAILGQLKQALPGCRLYLQTVLPRDGAYTARVRSLNLRYVRLAHEETIELVDLFPLFDDGQGRLHPELTEDDLHLLPAAYEIWREALARYIS